ncbi:Os11g0673200 [Oryza sativa Japonica Group]|uniref:Os11g0673200 protein n=1 Tax=Oryza sativa subsp. japonica TaxID=39947 RepID=Q0IR61_ORYSJ|nr:Os11g0673200 [Oryza sativa Japonica Group]|eukprot:NP_001068441.1 Os11g0673200 [Oryza sativa Japonica Group]
MRRLLLLPLLVLAGAAVGGGVVPVAARSAFACAAGGPAATLPFCRRSLPARARARDLVARLTRAEKVRLLVNNAAGVPRLGVAGYEWWSEALHGVSDTGPGVRFGGAFPGATAFPQVIGTAASFNATLWELIGQVMPILKGGHARCNQRPSCIRISVFMYVYVCAQAVSDEGRAMYNGGQAGLTFWSPNVNIFRDPRWGRGQETPGEDPAVAARYAAAYVRGLQQQQPSSGRLKLAACCKHFTAYDLDNWSGTDRFHFNAVVTRQDLEDTFNVPFRSCVVDGRAASVMCSYNQVNGVPTCADAAFLRGTIRRRWGLAGYIVSDCDSVDVFYSDQHYTRTREDAVAATLRAGLDLDCGPFLAQYTEGAVAQGKVGDGDIDAAVTNTVTVQMRLGMFDGDPAAQPFGHLGPQHVCTAAHQELAVEAARQGIVLLKNDGRALPLSPATARRAVAVVGPHAEATVAMIGNYAGKPCRYTTPLQGVARYAARAAHQPGCTDVACAGSGQPIAAAVDAARRADATIVVAGLDQKIEAEGLDRASLLLPGRQAELISSVAKASKGPVILVLMSGGPIDIGFAQNDPKIAGILWAGYPGQAGGQAIADVIFGHHNPGGKLPVTWYPQDYLQKVPMTNMAMRANPAKGYPGRTYRFYTGPTIHPFGHGLSYTSFTHSIAHAPSQLTVRLSAHHAAASASASLNATARLSRAAAVRVAHARCEELRMPVHVDVRNVGERDGAHTVLVYAAAPASSAAEAAAGHGAPVRQLVAFEKVHVGAGGTARVEMGIDVCDGLSVADRNGVRRIPVGEHRLIIGELTHTVTIALEQLGV